MQVIATGAQVGCGGGDGLVVLKVMGPNCEAPLQLVPQGERLSWQLVNERLPVISMPFRTWPGELTVHDWLREMFPNQRTYMYNRLDFATSGLMLVALNQQAAKHASALFRKREVGPKSWMVL